MTHLRPAQRFELALILLLAMAPMLLNGFYNPALASHPARFWQVEFLGFAALPLAVYIYGRARGLFANADIGLSTRVLSWNNPVLFAACVIVLPIVMLKLDGLFLDWAVRLLPPNASPEFDYRQMIPPPGPRTGLLRLLAVLYMALSAGLVEELLFRGLFRRMLPAGVAGAIAFVVLSPPMFALVHWEGGPTKLLYCYLWGISTCLMYLGTRNLWPLIVGHMLVDIHWLSQ